MTNQPDFSKLPLLEQQPAYITWLEWEIERLEHLCREKDLLLSTNHESAMAYLKRITELEAQVQEEQQVFVEMSEKANILAGEVERVKATLSCSSQEGQY